MSITDPFDTPGDFDGSPSPRPTCAARSKKGWGFGPRRESGEPKRGECFRLRHGIGQRPARMSESKTLPPPAILVVDDDPGLRSALTRILESEGYDCFEAADGESALDLMRAYELGLVVLDYAMPGLDGASVMRRMRNLPRQPATVMLTSGRHQSAQVTRSVSAASPNLSASRTFSKRSVAIGLA